MFKAFKHKKLGMTLAEILLVFVIMGIIAGMTMVTVKPGEKNLKYIYYRMYNSIGTAFYNSSINISEDLRDDPAMDKSYPTSAELFCKLLLEYINTKEGTAVSCSNNTVNVDNPDFSTDKIQFIASNGVRVWIGHSANGTPGTFSTYTGTDSTGTNFSLRYYWVFVDLNGQMGPNSPIPKGNKMADIVAFIVTEDYEVVPIGLPEVDQRYFVARVMYAEGGGNEEVATDASTTMPYLAAKRYAWGEPNKQFFSSSNEPMSINFYDGVNITNKSPFWLDYNSPEYNTIMSQTVNERCGKLQDGADPAAPVYEPEADSCYISIQDYY